MPITTTHTGSEARRRGDRWLALGPLALLVLLLLPGLVFFHPLRVALGGRRYVVGGSWMLPVTLDLQADVTGVNFVTHYP